MKDTTLKIAVLIFALIINFIPIILYEITKSGAIFLFYPLLFLIDISIILLIFD
jgi:hypothetical protein